MERLEITQSLYPSEQQLALIRRQMQDKGITQEAAGEVVGITRNNMNAILHGKRPIEVGALREICKAIGLRVMARLELDIYR